MLGDSRAEATLRRRGSGLAIQHQDLVHGSNANLATRLIALRGVNARDCRR